MDPPLRPGNTRTLWGLILLGVVFSALLRQFRSLTGTNLPDAVLSVALGLYICAYPAANAIDLFFLERRGLSPPWSTRSGLAWLALNALVLLVGWFVIFLGTNRLVR